jgi:hypothetical protein
VTSGADERGPFWERQDAETATAYGAFCVYRDQGIERSLRSAAAAFYSQRDGDYQGTPGEPPESAGSDSRLTRFKRWSRAHDWVARAEAFDAEEARARSLRRQKERDEMLDRHRNIALLGEKLASKVMFDLLRDEGYLPPSALPSLINSSTQLHRLSLGEPSERIEQTGDPDERKLDLSALTYEEIVFLDQIGEKMHGGG